MNYTYNKSLTEFKNLVGTRFQLYNSLFTSLPFHKVEKTGVLLSLFLLHCEEGYVKGKNPMELVDSFLSEYAHYSREQHKIDLLFRFIQFAERQVVLFDALEDASFGKVNDMNGRGTVKQLESIVSQNNKEDDLRQRLKDFSVRLVLTAHPTQFYPGEVLGIIHDLSDALEEGHTEEVNSYLKQLGRTPFFRKQKPTPYNEALSLVWYLENVFYHAAGNILHQLKTLFNDVVDDKNPVIRLGFWPGGDRDGNPFVKSETTLQVARKLKNAIMHCYYRDVREMKRRLTFRNVDTVLQEVEASLYGFLFENKDSSYISQDELIAIFTKLRDVVQRDHNGLHISMIDQFIARVQIFGTFFATLDIRQDSSVHRELVRCLNEKFHLLPKNYDALSEEEKIEALLKMKAEKDLAYPNETFEDTLKVMKTVKQIQKENGEQGCNRYIISHCETALDMMEVFALFKLSGWNMHKLSVDIVPLFETIEDLQNAEKVMKQLYENKVYSKHIAQRGNNQTIMLGFSDGTKDGGYLMANWRIYQAKEKLTALSRQYNINVLFFDGRGGPPSRGGGKTHRFYASMGETIENKEIQLTIQGQTVSSNFGTIDSAIYNIEQLINAGIVDDVSDEKVKAFTEKENALFEELANESFRSYTELKSHPYFLEYLSHASPLRFYGDTNIGSRPAKRNASSKINMNDLRAIPYVGSWSQIKQNVTGYYGLGTALSVLEKKGKWKELKALYSSSLFFRALMDNSQMSMQKCFFPITRHQSEHPVYGEVWEMVHEEFLLTEKMVLKLAGESELMEKYPVEKMSIQMRERIVLPLLTIQQYAMHKVSEINARHSDSDFKSTYEKMIMRCSFGIINAGRNSA
ncbi:phosphoenolpyruvate carboxylase [Haoranjiania flava]|uniref:Phosphoenolpyruvate carboxylase n=1 Tax=Haoranjiania flava TaxID=1856322 RepID=A0AAE3INU9_9BACT|nr:phosphoenolpyruvate carboxylase [Haoranjiania flava]MCU7694565.1 phosphoenolpyruvate carboxylase [Haoranjiania flava]